MRAVAGIPRVFRAAFWHDDAQRASRCSATGRSWRGLEAGQPRLAEAAMRMHIIGAAEFLTEVIDDDE